jgi:WD40 repeat protein
MSTERKGTCTGAVSRLRAATAMALWLAIVSGTSGQQKQPPAKPAASPPRPQVVLESGGHTAEVVRLFFTADGKQVVTVAQDQTVRYWDVESGEMTRVLRPACSVLGPNVAVSPDAKTLALMGFDSIVLMGVEEGRIRLLKLAPRAWAASLAFSPDSTRLAVGTNSHDAFVVDVKTGARVRSMTMPLHVVSQVGFSPDGRLLTALAGPVGTLDLKTGQKVEDAPGARGGAWCFAWAPDGGTLALGKRDGIEIWDPNHKKMLRKLDAGPTRSITFLPGGAEILTTGLLPREGRSRVSILDVATGKERKAFPLSAPWQPQPRDAALAPDGTLVAAASGPNNIVHIWKADGTLLRAFRGRGAPHFGAAWSPDGTAIAWGNTLNWLKGANYWQHRPLQTAFDLTRLQFVSRPDLRSYRRAVLRRDSDTLVPERSTLYRSGKEYNLQVWERDYSHAGTLLDNNRALTAGNEWMFYYDLSSAVADRDGKRFFLNADKNLDRRLLQDLIWDLAPSPDHRYVLSASRDQVLRVWRVEPKRLSLLLSLFVAGPDWISWTPQGYYAASANGEGLMGWQVSNGPGALASYYPARQFRESLHRPDVISRLLETGSLPEALAAANKARQLAPTEVVEVSEVLPPRVTLAAPKVSGGKVMAPLVEVEAEAQATGQLAVTSLQLLLDGRPYEGGKSLRKLDPSRVPQTVRETWTVNLPEGEHTLRALARTQASMGLSNELEITFAVPPPRPRLFLLAVGIDDYADSTLKLSCAVNDAQSIADTFSQKAPALFDVRPPKILKNDAATRAGIVKGLEWLKTMEARDVAVIFYAGHGQTDEKGSFYLLPHDFDKARLADTAVSGDLLKQHLAGLRGRVVLLLDACHSGAIGKVINDMARDLADEDCGVVVLCAALGSEKAGEANGHGFFCRALMEGLRGERGAPRSQRDGCVYLHHVEQYVTDRVQELSGDEQHPTAAKPAIRPLALAKP